MTKLKRIAKLEEAGLSVVNIYPAHQKVVATTRWRKKLRPIRNMIGKRQYAKALVCLNRLSGEATRPVEKMRLAGLVADLQFRQGKIGEAAASYRAAAAQVSDDVRDWLRPAIGEIIALLRDARVAEALVKARVAWNRAASLEQTFKADLEKAERELRATGQTTVGKRPLRSSVVGTRLGFLFLREGENAAAREFLNNALAVNPNGASKARLGLATLLLREGDLVNAELFARDALIKGKFRAKTLGAWPVLLAARQRRGLRGVPLDLLAGLSALEVPTVRGRAVVAIAQCCRRFRDESWISIATTWLASAGARLPIEATEIRKLLLAANNVGGKEKAAFAGAREMLAAPQLLSRSELLTATRRAVLAGEAGNLPLKLNAAPVLESAGALFGPLEGKGRLRHTVGLAFRDLGQMDKARQYLQANVNSLPARHPLRRKSLWALGKLAVDQEDFASAAQTFGSYLADDKAPTRFRVMAAIQWLQAVSQGNLTVSFDTVLPLLSTVLARVNKYELLMDVGSRLSAVRRNAPVTLLARDFRHKGEQLAETAIRQATDPTVAVAVLFRLFRRHHDYGDYAATIRVWESVASRQDWLWATHSEFWQMLMYAVRAYAWSKRVPEAEALAAKYLQDGATPPEGKGLLGLTLGIVYTYLGRIPEALAVFDRYASFNPGEPRVAFAYYWQGLRAFRAAQHAVAEEKARGIFTLLGEALPGLTWKQDLFIRADALRYRLNRARILASTPPYSENQLDEQLGKMRGHLARFAA